MNTVSTPKPLVKREVKLRDGGICISCGETMWVPFNQMSGMVHDKCKNPSETNDFYQGQSKERIKGYVESKIHSETNEHLHEPTPTINTTRHNLEKTINTNGKQQLTLETNEKREIVTHPSPIANKSDYTPNSGAIDRDKTCPKTNKADYLKEFDEYMTSKWDSHLQMFPEADTSQWNSGFGVAQEMAESFLFSSIERARREERRRWSKSLQDALDLRTELKEKIRFEGGVEAIEMVGKEIPILGKYYLQMWRDKYDKK